MKRFLTEFLCNFVFLTFSWCLLKAQPIIKLDSVGIKLQIPFNQPFFLKIDTVRGGDIDYIAVYQVTYIKGKGALIDPFGRPSFIVRPPNGFTRIGPSLRINFPAIKPESDFDVLVSSRFSAEHLRMALKINKELYKNKNEVDGQLLIDHPEIKDSFDVLYAAVNPSPYIARLPTVIFDYDLLSYRSQIYAAVEPLYDRIIPNDANLRLPALFPQNSIEQLFRALDKQLAVSYRLSYLQSINADGTLAEVFNGRLAATYLLPKAEAEADEFDFDKRIANLNASLRYVDSLDQCLGLLPIPAPYTATREILKAWADDLKYNRDYIKKLSTQITQGVLTSSHEALWLAQTTVSSDLKTSGTRHLTLDVGFTNIGAYDNQNDYKNIQKLFFGLNFYFVSIDKNVDFNRFPKPPSGTRNESHILESKYSVWQRLSLTAGFTLGAMQNKDFDNVYNGLSFTLGPSYRVGKYIKLSAGAALLKRFTTNPLESKSTLILGNYVSLALDYDLLGAVTNLTSLIF